jgi:hypothetical protein
MQYRINTPHVGSETIQGETIIIDFISGAYFSSDKIGSAIWEQLKASASSEQILHEIQRRYPDQQEYGPVVTSFLKQLEKENLIVIDSKDVLASTVEKNPPVCWPDQYTAPVLRKYTDMQDLLLLDPIHEVDEQGWPVRKEAPDSGSGEKP